MQKKPSEFTQEDGLSKCLTKRRSKISNSERTSAETSPDRLQAYHLCTTVQYFQLCQTHESYETIGGVLAEISKNSVELSVAERIWLLIVEVISVIAEVLNCDPMVLTEQIISNDKQIKAVKQAFDRLILAA